MATRTTKKKTSVKKKTSTRKKAAKKTSSRRKATTKKAEPVEETPVVEAPAEEAPAEEAQAASEHVVVMDGSVDISVVSTLRERLDAALATELPVVLDASDVERADAAAIQLLAAFFKHVDATETQTQWKGASEALRSSARMLGLEEVICLGNDA